MKHKTTAQYVYNLETHRLPAFSYTDGTRLTRCYRVLCHPCNIKIPHQTWTTVHLRLQRLRWLKQRLKVIPRLRLWRKRGVGGPWKYWLIEPAWGASCRFHGSRCAGLEECLRKGCCLARSIHEQQRVCWPTQILKKSVWAGTKSFPYFLAYLSSLVEICSGAWTWTFCNMLQAWQLTRRKTYSECHTTLVAKTGNSTGFRGELQFVMSVSVLTTHDTC